MNKRFGFTIVELLVVIVVIGILAAIIIISYSGISLKAKESSLQSDLSNASKQIKVFYTLNGVLPTSVNDCPSPASNNICLKPSADNSFQEYSVNTLINSGDFAISASNGNINYRITSDSPPIACASKFVVVPGSTTYGTKAFCVMKYEAKDAGSNTPVSQASGSPWVNMTQTQASSYSSNVSGCSGCHLISEAEWMTIAQNVLKQPINWSGGAVGSGFIFSGYDDNVNNSSAILIAASTDDSDGYANTGQSDPSRQRRTLVLSNGEVIWDIAGNAWEWTSGTVQSPAVQPGVSGSGLNWRQWPSATNRGSGLAADPTPEGTGIAGAISWNDTNGIGWLYTDSDDTTLRGVRRGGFWNSTNDTGVLTLNMAGSPSLTRAVVGFRVAR